MGSSHYYMDVNAYKLFLGWTTFVIILYLLFFIVPMEIVTINETVTINGTVTIEPLA